MRNQFRWSGLLTMGVAAALGAAPALQAAGLRWPALEALRFGSLLGLLLASTAVYAALAGPAGWLGLAGYAAVQFGAALALNGSFLQWAWLAGLIDTETARLAAVPIPLDGLSLGLLWVGQALLGAASARADLFPRWVGGLLMLGAMFAVFAQWAGPLPALIGALSSGAGWGAAGWRLWRGAADQPAAPSPFTATLWRAGGLWIIITQLLFNIPNLLIYLGLHTPLTQGLYTAGLLGLILLAVIVPAAHGQRAGGWGMAALVSLSLTTALTGIVTFLIWIWTFGLRDLANRAIAASWTPLPVGRLGVDGIYFSFLLLGAVIVRAGYFPRWCGWLVIFGTALQMPSQFAADFLRQPVFQWFPPMGSALAGAALIWIGWLLFSRRAAGAAAYIN